MQPKNKPENLTPPHKGPSYCPKEKETKVIIEVLKSEEETKVKWHPYPQEIPEKENLYIVSIKDRKKSFTSASYWDRKVFGVYWDEDVTAWAELPKPYKEEE